MASERSQRYRGELWSNEIFRTAKSAADSRKAKVIGWASSARCFDRRDYVRVKSCRDWVPLWLEIAIWRAPVRIVFDRPSPFLLFGAEICFHWSRTRPLQLSPEHTSC